MKEEETSARLRLIHIYKRGATPPTGVNTLSLGSVSPVPAERLLRWVDMEPGKHHLVKSSAGAVITEVDGEQVAKKFPDGTSVYYGALRDKLHVTFPDSNRAEQVIPVEPNCKLRMQVARNVEGEGIKVYSL